MINDRFIQHASILGLLVSAVLLGLVPAAWAAGSLPEFNLLGTQTSPGSDITITSMDMSSGAFSGTAEVDAEYFSVAGTESGNVATFDLTETNGSGYVSHNTVTWGLLADGNVGGPGEFTDTNGTHETYTTEITKPTGTTPATVTVACTAGGGSDTCTAAVSGAGGVPTGNVTFTPGAGTLSASACVLSAGDCSVTYTPASASSGVSGLLATYSGDASFQAAQGSPTPNQRTSATQLTCNLEESSGEYDCSALVADASGSSNPQTPTGTVLFTSSTGTFPAAGSCALAAVEDEGGLAQCDVTYNPPAGGVPAGTTVPVSAHYGGDATFAASDATSTTEAVSLADDTELESAQSEVCDSGSASSGSSDSSSVAVRAAARWGTAGVLVPMLAHDQQYTYQPGDSVATTLAKTAGGVAEGAAQLCAGGAYLAGKALEAASGPTAQAIVLGAGAVGSAATAEPVPVVVASTVALAQYPAHALGQGISQVTGNVYDDPPRADYRTIAPVTVYRPVRAAGGKARLMARLLADERDAISLSQAVSLAIDRTSGARRAHNTVWEGRQARALLADIAKLRTVDGRLLSLLPQAEKIAASAPKTTGAQLKLAKSRLRHASTAQLERLLGAVSVATGLPVTNLRADALALTPAALKRRPDLFGNPRIAIALHFERGCLAAFAKVRAIVAAAHLR